MEPDQAVERPTICPECGVAFPAEKTSCWLCGWKLGDPVSAHPVKPVDTRLTTFSRNTLFLWTALVAVVMGVARIAPGLGITLGIFCVPAAVHTTAVVADRKNRSRRALAAPEKILVFIESFALFLLAAIAVLVAAISALAVISLSGPSTGSNGRMAPGNGDLVLNVFATVAGIAAIGLTLYLLVRIIRRRTKD
jgi:hypothetical protein